MTRLLIWRHGQTAWNAAGRVQGQTDVDLDEIGRAQAVAAAPLLAAADPDAIVASDLSRARDTAEALAVLTGLPVHTDPRLRERCYGAWEGLSDDEIVDRYPEQFAAWRAGMGRGAPGQSTHAKLAAQVAMVPGLESHADLAKRAGEGLRAAVERSPEGTVVVATHGGAAQRGIGDLLGWPDEVLATMHSLLNCHFSELRLGRNGWRLHAHNVGPTASRH